MHRVGFGSVIERSHFVRGFECQGGIAVNNFSRWIICVMIAGVQLAGQVASVSQIRGSIQDSSGAAIAGAEVKATQTGTGAVRTVISDRGG